MKLVVALCFLAVSPATAASWIRVASPHFEIYTDAGDRTARRVLTRFEQAHCVLSSGQLGESPGSHIRVLLFSSERDYNVLRPASNVPAFFQSGPEHDYIAMLAGSELDRVILHEYTHSVLNHSSAPLPQWLEEGLAELYSTLSVGEKRATVGASIPAHLETLESGRWLTADQLSSVTQRSANYNEVGKTGIFYAESWALTHMLTFGELYRGKMPGFLDALKTGEAPQKAFSKAFGRSMDTALTDLATYVHLGFRTLDVDLLPTDQLLFSETTSLSPAEAQQARGEVLLLMGRDTEAQHIYETIAKRYPDSPASAAGLAVVAMRDHNYQLAREDFEHAIELGAKDGSTYFEYAMLLRDTGAAPDLVNTFLQKAVVANPAHAEAHFLLGIRASDAEHYPEAVEHLRRATEILPRQAYFWQALSYAYHRLGRSADARTAALHALRCAHTDHETEMAQNAWRLIEEPQATTARTRQPDVVTPESWTNRKGNQSVSGELTQVDCGERSARLHVRSGSETLVLNVKDPTAVVMRGGSVRHSFACGRQEPTSVLVEFSGETNEVTAIEFR